MSTNSSDVLILHNVYKNFISDFSLTVH